MGLDTREILHAFVNKNIRAEAEAMYTAEPKGYLGIEDEDTYHETVNHPDEEWRAGGVHATGI